MTTGDKILALLAKIDPAICGAQDMKDHAAEVKVLVEKMLTDAGALTSVSPSTLDDINDKLAALDKKIDGLGGQMAAVERTLAGQTAPRDDVDAMNQALAAHDLGRRGRRPTTA